MRIRICSIGICLFLAVAAAGCGSSKPDAATVSSAEEVQTESADAEAAASSAETEETAPDSTVKQQEQADSSKEETTDEVSVLENGVYAAEVELTGGTGKAHVESPCEVTVEDGRATARILWSSPYYDYMIVDGETYDPVNKEGNSCFEIPVIFDEIMEVQADTTAMSTPHLIDYTLQFTLTESAISGGSEGAGQEKAAESSSENSAEAGTTGSSGEEEAGMVGGADGSTEARTAPEIAGLTFVSEMERHYAEDFSVFYYENGYKVLTAESGRQYLLVPEGGSTPETLPDDMTVISMPVSRIYLAASSAMALFHALDSLDAIAFSGTNADGWYIEEAANAMRSGAIAFAGKYSQPDYEGLLAGGCDLAVESTMILHTPEAQEKLESLGIPVLIDESSHEPHPLGRTEWIRFYGALLDKEEEADAYFATQNAIIEELKDMEDTGKTVAFFFVNSKGNVVVRKTDDYIPKMIDLAGGEYVFRDLESPNPESTSGSVSLSMEEFYAQARDCDYLIYNASIDSPLTDMADLLDKSPVFADFKAVKEGHVYTTDKYMYQATDIMGEMIRDIHKMLTGTDDSDMLFLKKISL